MVERKRAAASPVGPAPTINTFLMSISDIHNIKISDTKYLNKRIFKMYQYLQTKSTGSEQSQQFDL